MELIVIISIVFGVLQLILFFKIWQMTDDVRAIRIKIAPEEPVYIPSRKPELGNPVFSKSMNEKGIFKGMINGKAEVEFSDGGLSYLPPSDIEPICEESSSPQRSINPESKAMFENPLSK